MLNHISLTIMSAAVVAWLAMLQPADAQKRTLGGGLLGAGIGAAVGGGKGAAVGGLIGAGAAGPRPLVFIRDSPDGSFQLPTMLAQWTSGREFGPELSR